MPLKRLLSLFSRRSRWSLPEGRRVYAVGDIHGRLDLLDPLLAQIEADDAQRGEADTLVIFLGDLVDRGPDSRGVVERLLDYSRGPRNARFLLGNHEQVFLRAASGDARATRHLIRMGGDATILSYGISREELRGLDYQELTAAFAARVPQEHCDFLSGFERRIAIGDYLFVHAGVRPGVPVDEQADTDLCWIREDFLLHRGDFGHCVVHGHTPTEKVEFRSNRIGVDTGAFASGRLTALGLEGHSQWVLQADAENLMAEGALGRS